MTKIQAWTLGAVLLGGVYGCSGSSNQGDLFADGGTGGGGGGGGGGLGLVGGGNGTNKNGNTSGGGSGGNTNGGGNTNNGGDNTGASSSSSSGGNNGGGGTATNICAPSANDSACDSCIKNSCCAEAKTCTGGAECSALGKCAQTCEDQSCINDCGNAHQAGVAPYNALLTCAQNSCASQCQ